MSVGEQQTPHPPASSGLPIRFPLPASARGAYAQLRATIRSSELLLVLVSVLVGCAAGLMVVLMSKVSQTAHVLIFGIPVDERLSAADHIAGPLAIAGPAIGGLLLGLIELWRRFTNSRTPVDPIEANALRGGRMSLRDSAIVSLQTLISNGFGASVGLEAGYTQIGSGMASRIGRSLKLRRNDMRIMVGAGAAGAIAAAFGAPLTGAFYAFELVVGVYSVANVASIMAASLAAYLTSDALAGAPYSLHAPPVALLHPTHYLALLFLGLIIGGVAVGVMRALPLVEKAFEKTRLPVWLRPVAGGVLVGLLALVTPQILAAGHGAMRLDVPLNMTMKLLAGLIALKLLAAMISLGSGFRGGLFFASLFLGSLMGKLYGVAVHHIAPEFDLDQTACLLAGMGTMAVAVVGGPLTMSFLVLETTGDFSVTSAVLAACVATSLFVRETFGYSFSTWRLHLRGETIRSAADVGWIRSMTVGRLMRRDPSVIAASAPLSEFRRRYPLGSTHMVVVLDREGRYAGLVPTAEAFASELDNQVSKTTAGDIARFSDTALLPEMNVKEAMDLFDNSEAETLAVVDTREDKQVLGLLTEAYAVRRYAEELDKASRDVMGEV